MRTGIDQIVDHAIAPVAGRLMAGTRLTLRAHQIVGAQLRSGDVAVDATVGNGHDTEFLARIVGPSGRVYGFDLQGTALDTTRDRLDRAGVGGNVTLIHAGHEEMSSRLPADASGSVGAVMFNLGYLPGSDRSLVTRPETTVPAVEAAISVLRPGGILSVLVYTGHPGGTAELEALRRQSAAWRERGFQVAVETRDAPHSPVLFTAIKTAAGEG